MQRELVTLPRATPSTGTPAPMVRHIVEQRPEGGPRDVALCGEPWDRLHVSPGPMCEPCEAEYRRRHPTWPLPGEMA